MTKQTTNRSQSSIVVWGKLEEWVRLKVQEFIQSMLAERRFRRLDAPEKLFQVYL